MREDQEEFGGIFKVRSDSSPNLIAGALAINLREQKDAGVKPIRAEIQAIGPAAVNQAVKAIIILRGFLSPSGINIYDEPSFTTVMIDSEERTAIRFIIKELA